MSVKPRPQFLLASFRVIADAFPGLERAVARGILAVQQAIALWTIAKGRMALRAETLPPVSENSLILQAICSGVSRGTERLVLSGAVPDSERDRMRCPHQAGDFPFPVKYGYCLVGRVVEGPADRIGQVCFALHPHQDRAVVAAAAAIPLPAGLPPRRAVLGANMETALNVVWDAGLAPGDRALVVGAGVVGLLVAALAARIPGTEIWLSDLRPGRAALAEALGARFALPDALPADVDVAINASASAAGLQAAMAAAGTEARVVEASWHGDRDVALPLGGAFHSRRLRLISSQVGRIPADRSARWDYRRRLAKALDLLAGMPALDALLGPEVPFTSAPERLPALLDADADALCPVLTYD